MDDPAQIIRALIESATYEIPSRVRAFMEEYATHDEAELALWQLIGHILDHDVAVTSEDAARIKDAASRLEFDSFDDLWLARFKERYPD